MAKGKGSSPAAEQPAAPGIAASNRLADLAGRIRDAVWRVKRFPDCALRCAKTGKFAGFWRARGLQENPQICGFGRASWLRKLLEFEHFLSRRGTYGANGPSIQPSANLRKVGDLTWHGSADHCATIGGSLAYRSATVPRGAFQ